MNDWPPLSSQFALFSSFIWWLQDQMQRVNKVVWGCGSYCDRLSHWCLWTPCRSSTEDPRLQFTHHEQGCFSNWQFKTNLDLWWSPLLRSSCPFSQSLWVGYPSNWPKSVPFKPTCWCRHSWSKYSSFPKIHFHLPPGRGKSSHSLSLLDWNLAGP